MGSLNPDLKRGIIASGITLILCWTAGLTLPDLFGAWPWWIPVTLAAAVGFVVERRGGGI